MCGQFKGKQSDRRVSWCALLIVPFLIQLVQGAETTRHVKIEILTPPIYNVRGPILRPIGENPDSFVSPEGARLVLAWGTGQIKILGTIAISEDILRGVVDRNFYPATLPGLDGISSASLKGFTIGPAYYSCRIGGVRGSWPLVQHPDDTEGRILFFVGDIVPVDFGEWIILIPPMVPFDLVGADYELQATARTGIIRAGDELNKLISNQHTL
ncbi:MAG: hypothetical protein LBI20_01230 [Holosporales bacterium]|nr:hypothetical protein [Holosporales bacterium]